MSDIQAQIQNLLEEIAFQRVLLESIDDSVLNREVAQKEIEDEILTLQRQVKALKRGTTAAASSSSSTQQSSAPTQTSSPRQKSAGGAIGLASTSSMAGFQGKNVRFASPGAFLCFICRFRLRSIVLT